MTTVFLLPKDYSINTSMGKIRSVHSVRPFFFLLSQPLWEQVFYFLQNIRPFIPWLPSACSAFAPTCFCRWCFNLRCSISLFRRELRKRKRLLPCSRSSFLLSSFRTLPLFVFRFTSLDWCSSFFLFPKRKK